MSLSERTNTKSKVLSTGWTRLDHSYARNLVKVDFPIPASPTKDYNHPNEVLDQIWLILVCRLKSND